MRMVALPIIALTLYAPCDARADKTKDTLDTISVFADQMCVSVAQSGHTTSITGDGKLNANLTGLAKRLADLGVEGAGKIASTDYAGVLQEQLAATLGDIRQCKLKIFDSLQKKLLSSGLESVPNLMEERLRVAQQRLEMSAHQCRVEADSIRISISDDGSSYSYAVALDQVEPDTLAYLRIGDGEALVDEFVRLRTRSGKIQGEYGNLAASLSGVRGVLVTQMEQRDNMRKGYYPPTVAQAVEGPIRQMQAQIAATRTKEGPLGRDVLATYIRACDVLTQLTTLLKDRLLALKQD